MVVELRKLVIGEGDIRNFWRIVTSVWVTSSRREGSRIRRWLKKGQKALSTMLCVDSK